MLFLFVAVALSESNDIAISSESKTWKELMAESDRLDREYQELVEEGKRLDEDWDRLNKDLEDSWNSTINHINQLFDEFEANLTNAVNNYFDTLDTLLDSYSNYSFNTFSIYSESLSNLSNTITSINIKLARSIEITYCLLLILTVECIIIFLLDIHDKLDESLQFDDMFEEFSF